MKNLGLVLIQNLKIKINIYFYPQTNTKPKGVKKYADEQHYLINIYI